MPTRRLFLPLVLLLAPPLAAVELVPGDVPGHPEAVERFLERRGPDRLGAEQWILLPAGRAFQAIGDRGRAAAEEAVDLMTQGGWTMTRENWQQRGGEFWFRKEVITDQGTKAEAEFDRLMEFPETQRRKGVNVEMTMKIELCFGCPPTP